METIKAVLFEPVGCLAEFRPDEFDRAAFDLFGTSPDAEATGSQAYWGLLGLMQQGALSADNAARLEALELQAVEHAELYEDVRFALEELKSLRRSRDPGLLAVAGGARALHRAPCARRPHRRLVFPR